jgi:hypothetical protein
LSPLARGVPDEVGGRVLTGYLILVKTFLTHNSILETFYSNLITKKFAFPFYPFYLRCSNPGCPGKEGFRGGKGDPKDSRKTLSDFNHI